MKDIKVTLHFLLIKYNCGIETNLNIFYKKGLILFYSYEKVHFLPSLVIKMEILKSQSVNICTFMH